MCGKTPIINVCVVLKGNTSRETGCYSRLSVAGCQTYMNTINKKIFYMIARAKDYCIPGRANPIFCAVGLR